VTSRSQAEARVAALEASLVDLERERERGEISDERYHELRNRDEAALTVARAELQVAPEPTPPVRRRRPKRRLYVALGCFAVAVVVVLVSSLTPRQAGDSITGQVNLDRAQRIARLLTQAEADVADGQTTTALAAYNEVLSLAPRNVTALTQSGWLSFSAGSSARDAAVIAEGQRRLRRALSLAPKNPAPHLYYAIVALSFSKGGDIARREFTTFLTLHPSRAQLAVAAPFLKQLGFRAN